MSVNTSKTKQKTVMITDLDQSDDGQLQHHASSSVHHRKTVTKKRPTGEKKLCTLSGSFHRRSRSVECHLEKCGSEKLGGEEEKLSNKHKVHSYFNELLQSKEKQMEKLLQRLTTLHKFNEQFADENQKLREEVQNMDEQIEQLRKQISNCDNCQRLSQVLSKTVQLNKTLSTDVTMMKTLVYRLNVQIEGYQDQLRLGDKSRPTAHSVGDGSCIEPWSKDEQVHAYTLSPLLKSYDEMINDKEQLIQQYKHEFELFTGELKRVLEENNKLMQQSEALKRDSGNWREERTRLQAQLDVCRSKAEAQTRKCDLAKEKLVEVMHCYEQKMQALVLDQEHLQSAYARCKAELASLKAVAAQPQDVIASSLQECKELLEQLRQQHSREKQNLEKQITQLSEQHLSTDIRTRELQLENASLQKELSLQKDNSEGLLRKSSALQRNCEKVKRSRDRLKARLRIALQWAQKLEEGQANIQNTWDALKRLETIVKHKESQVRGLHDRHLQEIDKMQKKLAQKEETIRTILKGKLEGNAPGVK